MNCFLGIPLIDEQGMVGMLGVANRPGGYDEEMMLELAPLSTTIALLLRRHRTLRDSPPSKAG